MSRSPWRTATRCLPPSRRRSTSRGVRWRGSARTWKVFPRKSRRWAIFPACSWASSRPWTAGAYEALLEHYDGKLRFMDDEGQLVADQIDPTKYRDYIGEAAETGSFLKSPYYKPEGYPAGMYRVGPLARPQHHRPLRHAAGGHGVARVQGAGARHRTQFLSPALRAADRDPLRHRAHRAAPAGSRYP